MADFIQAPPDAHGAADGIELAFVSDDIELAFVSDDIEAELACLIDALKQASFDCADLAEAPLIQAALAETAPRERYRLAGPAVIKVAAIGLASFPAALAPFPAFATEPLPPNMMLALAQRPEAPPAMGATGAQFFPFARPLPSPPQQVANPAPAAGAQADKRFALNPKLKTLLSESRQVAVTSKRGPAATFYQVSKGDSLYSIAADLHGSGARWRELYSANQNVIKAVHLLKPGQRLVIPGGHLAPAPIQLAAQKAPPANSPTANAKGAYRVAPGDSLYTIAARHLGKAERWREIVAMNKSALHGTTLITPTSWLQLPTHTG